MGLELRILRWLRFRFCAPLATKTKPKAVASEIAEGPECGLALAEVKLRG